jgi:transcriptional regulator with XRE-family HTH domain
MGSTGSGPAAHGMTLPVASSAGAIVRAARFARGWSQGELGKRCGYSASTISRLESGKTPLRDVVLLRALAEVLEVPTEVFGLSTAGDMPTPNVRIERTGPPTVVPIAVEQEDSVQRRELLSGLVGLVGVSVLPAHVASEVERDGVVKASADLLGRVGQARADFNACRYSDVAAAVPEIVATGHQLLADTQPGLRKDQLSATLADAYSLASFVSQKLGDYGLSWLMADRARAHAEASGDPTSLAVATREVAVASRNAGYFDNATRLLTTTADSLSTVAADSLAARGCLLLTAAYTQAKNGNSGAAMDLIADAQRVARHLPARSSTSIFVPTQVPVYAVSVHNALGNFSRALVAARSVSLAALPSVERRVKVCLDVARAYLGYGDAPSSLNTLQKLERLAPEDARRPSVNLLVRQLLELPGPQPVGLTAFARRNGAYL